MDLHCASASTTARDGCFLGLRSTSSSVSHCSRAAAAYFLARAHAKSQSPPDRETKSATSITASRRFGKRTPRSSRRRSRGDVAASAATYPSSRPTGTEDHERAPDPEEVPSSDADREDKSDVVVPDRDHRLARASLPSKDERPASPSPEVDESYRPDLYTSRMCTDRGGNARDRRLVPSERERLSPEAPETDVSETSISDHPRDGDGDGDGDAPVRVTGRTARST